MKNPFEIMALISDCRLDGKRATAWGYCREAAGLRSRKCPADVREAVLMTIEKFRVIAAVTPARFNKYFDCDYDNKYEYGAAITLLMDWETESCVFCDLVDNHCGECVVRKVCRYFSVDSETNDDTIDQYITRAKGVIARLNTIKRHRGW